jgi:hypothetical protein
MPIDYVAIPIEPLPVVPEEQKVVEDIENEQPLPRQGEEGCVCQGCAGWAVGANIVLMLGMVGAVIYGFVWIGEHYN